MIEQCLVEIIYKYSDKFLLGAPVSLAVRAFNEVTNSELLYPSQPEGLSSELAETLLSRATDEASVGLTPTDVPEKVASMFFIS